MLRFIFSVTIALYLVSTLFSRNEQKEFFTQPIPAISHDIWDQLLKKHVSAEGLVDYKGFLKDSAQLNVYLDLLQATSPEKAWPKEKEMAYWINAYNAFTVKLILDHYPVSSIKDIKKGIPFVNTVWDIKFINIQGKKFDLNNIEHGILRKKFEDARIHAAVNCASISCPKLRNEAFTPEKLESQLEDSMRKFINDPSHNQVRNDKAEVSAIFNWFTSDFKADAGSLHNFINRYSNIKMEAGAKISYLDYNWNLNEIKT
ncbi:MAG: DUF547 domain-containing protein [Saprospiraceae bacterium]|nr:DUF547 domain-containing protein [Saprospiraceae bacterium]